jgi:YHS domain-containing protein
MTTAIDPVRATPVQSVSAKASHVYEGTHYFCSEHGLEEFKATADFVEGAKHRPSGNSGARAKCTCPMHPEIVRDALGDCPICGMALVPIYAVALARMSAGSISATIGGTSRQWWRGAYIRDGSFGLP